MSSARIKLMTSNRKTHDIESNGIKKTCRNCGGAWPHAGQCPANGKKCRKCQKPNYFAQVCRGQSQRQNRTDRSTKHKQKRARAPINPISKVESDTDNWDNNDYLYTISNDKAPKVNAKLGQHSFKSNRGYWCEY